MSILVLHIGMDCLWYVNAWKCLSMFIVSLVIMEQTLPTLEPGECVRDEYDYI